MTEMFGEAWSPMSIPDLAPDDDDDVHYNPMYTYSNSRDIKNIFILLYIITP